jgi:hypothetical protein
MKKIMFNDRVVPMTYYVIDGLKTQTRRLVSGVSGRKGARLKLVLGKIRHNIHVWAQGRYYGHAWAGLFCDEVSEMSEGEYYLRFDDLKKANSDLGKRLDMVLQLGQNKDNRE